MGTLRQLWQNHPMDTSYNLQPLVEASFVNPPLAVSTVSCENEPDPNVLQR
ncbi:MAG: hypothetical protein IPN86_10535 [Saprospiraceae bacterium]|nr:hypothetical protein [Saprospiraceae bacterium]